MALEPDLVGEWPPRPRPLMTRGWVVACAVVALFTTDRVQRYAHRPLCVDACAGEGRTLLGMWNGDKSWDLFDNSINCLCSGSEHFPRYMTLYMTFKEHLDWYAAEVIIFGALLTSVATVRWLWRREATPRRRGE
jgi:hypothetical protein